MASCKILANITCSVVKFISKQFQTDECVFTRYVSNIIGSPSLTNEDLLVRGKFLTMEILPMQMRVYRSCSHPVAATAPMDLFF